MLRFTLVLAFVAIVCAGCQQSSSTSSGSSSTTSSTSASTPAPSSESAPSAAGSASRTTASGLKIEVLAEGSGAVAESGKTVSVHYTGRLTDGTKFDSSVDRGQPYTFVLGTAAVIAGWDEGLVGMKVGEKRRLTVPPSLGYGDRGNGPVPPNATMVFETEMMDVK